MVYSVGVSLTWEGTTGVPKCMVHSVGVSLTWEGTTGVPKCMVHSVGVSLTWEGTTGVPKCMVHSVWVSLNRDMNYRGTQRHGSLCWGKSELGHELQGCPNVWFTL